MKKLLIQDWVIPRIPERLEDYSESELPHYLVNKCYEFDIKTSYKLIREFEKAKSPLLDNLEALNVAKIVDMFVGWDILSSTTCILAQNYSFSKN